MEAHRVCDSKALRLSAASDAPVVGEERESGGGTYSRKGIWKPFGGVSAKSRDKGALSFQGDSVTPLAAYQARAGRLLAARGAAALETFSGPRDRDQDSVPILRWSHRRRSMFSCEETG